MYKPKRLFLGAHPQKPPRKIKIKIFRAEKKKKKKTGPSQNGIGGVQSDATGDEI
jgi:hypothetical protein